MLGCVDSAGSTISVRLLAVVLFVFVFVRYCLFRKSHLFVLMSIYTNYLEGEKGYCIGKGWSRKDTYWCEDQVITTTHILPQHNMSMEYNSPNTLAISPLP